jgi:hypothetical protein
MQRSRNQVWREEKNKVDAVRLDKARKLLQYKGSKCQRCGYDKCSAALDFHHLDPKQKRFTIASSLTRKMSDLIEEADKCILICSNCHRELHYNANELGRMKRVKQMGQENLFG